MHKESETPAASITYDWPVDAIQMSSDLMVVACAWLDPQKGEPETAK